MGHAVYIHDKVFSDRNDTVISEFSFSIADKISHAEIIDVNTV